MAKQIVGVDRLIWGSDVPCVLTLSEYRKQYDYLIQSRKFKKQELDKMLGENALKLYWNR